MYLTENQGPSWTNGLAESLIQWQLEDAQLYSTPKQSSAWLDAQRPSHYPGLGSAQIPKCGHSCPEIRALGVLFCFHFVFQGNNWGGGGGGGGGGGAH